MRRVTGFVLTLLGAFLIVVAALLRFWVAPAAAKFPLGEYQVIGLSGSGSYFSQTQLQELTGVSVGVTFTIDGNSSLGNGTNAVWNYFQHVEDTTNHQPIADVPFREAFNRKTGELVNCCGTFVSDPVTGKQNHHLTMSGVGLFFPIGTKAQNYTVFDTTAARTETAAYDGAATVDGILTYKFVEKVAAVKYGTYTVPGTVIGNPSEASVTLGEYYSATNTYYIDPETGAPLDTSQDQTIALGPNPSTVQILGSNISVIETSSSIQSSVNSDQSARQKLALVQDILPLIGLLLGIVLLVVGIILLWLGRDDSRQEPPWTDSRRLDTYPDPGPGSYSSR